ncbi:MAG: TIM barrel protein [Candidatus Aenigmarchaeota archaeon]|nr:TIM barrel protein [Candidatus Aenigmarchaeota archaeon]
MAIRIGTAGSPTGSNLSGMSALEAAGLHAMEVQFGRGVQMGSALAEKIGEERGRHDVALSVHAPYYINLLSQDDGKREASRARIVESCERARRMGASPVVFHPGYYGEMNKDDAYEEMKKQIRLVLAEIKGWNVAIAPENTGKDSQFGSVEEVLSLAKELKTSFCIDIAHLRAKHRGNEDVKKMLDDLPSGHMHFQYSGVEWNAGGEKRHVPIDEKHFTAFARELIERETDATIICESPDTLNDALKMKRIFERIDSTA